MIYLINIYIVLYNSRQTCMLIVSFRILTIPLIAIRIHYLISSDSSIIILWLLHAVLLLFTLWLSFTFLITYYSIVSKLTSHAWKCETNSLVNMVFIAVAYVDRKKLIQKLVGDMLPSSSGRKNQPDCPYVQDRKPSPDIARNSLGPARELLL